MTLMMRPSSAFADRHRDRGAGVGDVLAADEAFGNVHGDAAHGVFAEMLGHFENQAVAVVGGFERVQDLRQMAFEFDVDDGADDLRDVAGGQLRRSAMVRPLTFSMTVRALRRPR